MGTGLERSAANEYPVLTHDQTSLHSDIYSYPNAASAQGNADSSQSNSTDSPNSGQVDYASVFTKLSPADQHIFYKSLSASEQFAVDIVLSNTNPTVEQLQQVFAKFPADNLTTALAAVPKADVQAAIDAIQSAASSQESTNNGNSSSTDAQVSRQTDYASQFNNMSEADQQTFLNALPPNDRSALNEFLQHGFTLAQLQQQLASFPEEEVKKAFAAVSNPNAANNSDSIGNSDSSDKSNAADNGATDNDSGVPDWAKYGAAALVAGGGAIAWNKFKIGTKISSSIGRANNPAANRAAPDAQTGQNAGRATANAARSSEVSTDPQAAANATRAATKDGPRFAWQENAKNIAVEDQLEEFDKPTVMTEGPLKGGYVTRLITRTNGDIDAFNAGGVYGPGTEHIWQLYSPRDHNGAKVSRVTFNKNGDVTGENPQGINWTEKPGVKANYTQITWQKDGTILKGNPSGVDGPGSRTLVAELREPFRVESGPFAGMTMRSFHTTPVQDGYKVKVINPNYLNEGSTITSQTRTLVPDEFQALIESTKVDAATVAKLVASGSDLAKAPESASVIAEVARGIEGVVAKAPEVLVDAAKVAEVIH